jgi:S1-C subfamily serine protease
MLKKILKKMKFQYILYGLSGAAGAFLVAGCLAIVLIKSNNLHNHLLRNLVGPSVVKVVIPNRGTGSGFSTKTDSGRLVIVTNQHVCSVSKNGWVIVEGDNGIQSKKRILHMDIRHDLCIVEGDVRLPPLRIGEAPDKGDFHYIIGHPGGRLLTVSQGEYIGDQSVQLLDLQATKRENCLHNIVELTPVEQFMYGREFICVKLLRAYSSSAVAYGGNSGSPVVDAFGNVIGVLFAGHKEQEHNNAIVPVEHLKRVLSLL